MFKHQPTKETKEKLYQKKNGKSSGFSNCRLLASNAHLRLKTQQG